MIPIESLVTFFAASVLLALAPGPDNIFFLAFLPQFADPARGALALQMVLLGGIFILATILIFGTIALLAGTLGSSPDNHEPRREPGFRGAGPEAGDYPALEVVSKPPLGPNLCVRRLVPILEIPDVFLRLDPHGRLNLEPD